MLHRPPLHAMHLHDLLANVLQNLDAHVAILVLVCESSVHYDFILQDIQCSIDILNFVLKFL